MLSPHFLATYRPRLDAIAAWGVLAGGDELDIDWPRPAALAAHGFPFDLRLHVSNPDADSAGDLDPDARMFELWELFLARQAALVTQIRRKVVAPDGSWHAVESAELLVARFRDGNEDDEHFLSVRLHFALDSEHQVVSEYDEDSGEFGPPEVQ